MPGSALAFRCPSHFLFGLLQAIAVKDVTVVAGPEVRIRVRVVNNQTPKRRSVQEFPELLFSLCIRGWRAASANLI